MRALTDRQKEILKMVSRYVKKMGFPPTRIEICEALGFKSPNAAEEHLKALEKKGAISMIPGASRSIKLIHKFESTSTENIVVPVIGRVSAGSPILAEEHVETHFSLDPNLFHLKPEYLLRVKGMSMKNAGILDDDFLAVKKNYGNYSSKKANQIIVARIEEEVTVKRFEKKGSKVFLHPENSDYETIEIDLKKQSFAIEGYAVGIIRNPKSGL
ncbi:MAG: repressor LexA [Betaproteobacteria bacterium TMED156]|nr:MAG: repressor LexA [Betaproteobacteria bacterium TMED156]|tara:strand:+ start:40 stop:681 length:642 start_codon:yes stop_codon:yes gene_type:complete